MATICNVRFSYHIPQKLYTLQYQNEIVLSHSKWSNQGQSCRLTSWIEVTRLDKTWTQVKLPPTSSVSDDDDDNEDDDRCDDDDGADDDAGDGDGDGDGGDDDDGGGDGDGGGDDDDGDGDDDGDDSC